MSLIPIDEVVHFDVITSHPSTAAATDADSTPTFDVYKEATDTGLLGATNLTKRTSLTGNYRGTFTASAANGFEAGKWYNVVASATVNSIAGKGVVMTFRVAPVETSAGVPKTDTALWLGSAPNALQSGRVDSYLGAVASGVIAAASFAANALDAVWSTATRTLTAASDSSGVTTLLSRIASALTITTGKVDVNDKTGFALTAAYDPAKTASQAGDAMTLTVAYDAAKTAASQTSVDDLPTNAELATALGTADDATLAAIAALNDLSQADIRTATGLASANLDTQLAAIAGYVDTEVAAILSAVNALSIPTAGQNAAALLDLSDGIEVGLTPRQGLRLMAAAMAGKVSGAATTTIVIRNAVADSKDRITATCDADGNRSAITVDLT